MIQPRHCPPVPSQPGFTTSEDRCWRSFQSSDSQKHARTMEGGRDYSTNSAPEDTHEISSGQSFKTILYLTDVIFLLRDQWMKDWAKRWRRLGRQQLLANSIENFISHSIAGVVACFPQVSLSLPAATTADSETPCVCARPSDQRKQNLRAAPKAWPSILPAKVQV